MKPIPVFGAGSATIIPTMDINGTAITNATPINIPEVQGVEVPFKRDLKQLFGQQAYAIESAHGKGSATISMNIGRVYAELVAGLFTGNSPTSGRKIKTTQKYTVPSTPYQVQIVGLTEDLGVRDQNGLAFTRAASPSLNKYSLSGDTYTFHSTNSGDDVWISYLSDTTGETVTINSELMGKVGECSIAISFVYNGQHMILQFPRCVISSEFGISTKLDDYANPKLTFDVIADYMTDVIGTISLPGIGGYSDGYMVVAGGTVLAGTQTNAIELFDFTTLTVSSSTQTLSTSRHRSAQIGFDLFGIFAGGFQTTATGVIDKFDYYTMAVTTLGASLNTPRWGAFNNVLGTNGYISGGQDSIPTFFSSIERVQYSNLTPVTIVATLNTTQQWGASCDNQNLGVGFMVSGPMTGINPVSTIQKITALEVVTTLSAAAELKKYTQSIDVGNFSYIAGGTNAANANSNIIQKLTHDVETIVTLSQTLATVKSEYTAGYSKNLNLGFLVGGEIAVATNQIEKFDPVYQVFTSISATLSVAREDLNSTSYNTQK